MDMYREQEGQMGRQHTCVCFRRSVHIDMSREPTCVWCIYIDDGAN